MWSDGWERSAEVCEAQVAEPPTTEPPVRRADMARILREVASTRDRPEGEPLSASELAYGSGTSVGSSTPAPTLPRAAHSASDRMGGAHGPATLHLDGALPVAQSTQRPYDRSQRIEASRLLADGEAAAIVSTLIPAYRAARDARDTQAVAEIGGRLIASFVRMHGAKAAFDELRTKTPRQSVAGGSADAERALAEALQAADDHTAQLDAAIRQADQHALVAMIPHEFRGKPVADVVLIATDSAHEEPATQLRARLAGELDRTLSMLVLVEKVVAAVNAPAALDRAAIERMRRELASWGSRPVDLAFLKAALGPAWQALDAMEASTPDPLSLAPPTPSAALKAANKQALHTGWFGDVGAFNIDHATERLRLGGADNARIVLDKLYTADPDARAGALLQLRQRGVLGTLCSSLGWSEVKALHDSLGFGYADLRSELQSHFIGKHKWGPSLGEESDGHENSLHHHLGRVPVVGGAANFILDLATFGVHSSYGKARDAHTRGETSDADYAASKRHLVARTAATAAVALLTGGAADKLVRGGATTVSTTRAAAAGASAGSVGATASLATTDAYNVFVSGEQEAFSSLEDYVKAGLLGGALGAVGGAASNAIDGLSKRARGYMLENVGGGAQNAANALRLGKQLATEAGCAELAAGGGKPMAGAGTGTLIRDEPRLLAEYGGKPGDWSKVTSATHKFADLSTIEVHAYRNVTTHQVVEPKTKLGTWAP